MIYRLINLARNSSDLEEAIFTVHGIVLEKDFPPIDYAKLDALLPHHFISY